MEKNDLGRCSKLVSHSSMGFHQQRCSFKAVVVREGKGYCKIHDPEYIKQKREERSKRCDKEDKERSKQWVRNSLEKEYCKDISTEELKKLVEQKKEKE